MNDANPTATRDSIPQRLLAAADLYGDAPAYWTRGAEAWEPTSWRLYAAEVQQAARALIALGLPRGGSVAILGFNRPEWAVMAQAAMLAGGKLAGIYWTSAPVEVDYVLGHAQAHVLLVENAEQAAKVGPGGAAILVAMRGQALSGALAWDDFLAKGTEQHAAEVDKRLGELVDSTPAVLIYTSGTTGNPKAVTLTQRALTWTSDALCRTLTSRPDDRVLSYLPLAHIA
jgi:long-chain acyl-CoA synthetase